MVTARGRHGIGLDRGADVAQDGADLAAQEDEGHDGHDDDEGEDERLLGEALAVFLAAKGHQDAIDQGHVENSPSMIAASIELSQSSPSDGPANNGWMAPDCRGSSR